ncbi:uncharacterized protein EI90DRAFT_3020048 [Cantharellus anzutake]|uniref:uncharacterized protein n=1 Tax=Cantharellus anzutake TaxID=1750568 RepID=UPI0019063443|nr:uncharacterized protein EI90DRAFT_3020048 [Cantharellus anzutake]KAF8322785.1 hypothetical protein EI90DRAFT_3020048 [Cantharellus anzutake]
MAACHTSWRSRTNSTNFKIEATSSGYVALPIDTDWLPDGGLRDILGQQWWKVKIEECCQRESKVRQECPNKQWQNILEITSCMLDDLEDEAGITASNASSSPSLNDIGDDSDKGEDGVPVDSPNPSFHRLSGMQSAVNSFVVFRQESQTRVKPATGAQKAASPWGSRSQFGNLGAAYSPWKSKEEWELVEWLCKSELSQLEINKFLQLDYTCHLGLSFSSAKEVYAVIHGLLPKGPLFQHATIMLKDAPDELHELYFRDIVACAALLFSNPDYWEEMDYEPEELFATNEDGSPSTNRVYAELSSGWIWNEEQPSKWAWILLANLPISKFSSQEFHGSHLADEAKGMPGLLRKILYHKCLCIILKPLHNFAGSKQPIVPIPLLDAQGMVRMCVLTLMAWIADLEEVLDLLQRNECPKCVAKYKDLGGSWTCKM